MAVKVGAVGLLVCAVALVSAETELPDSLRSLTDAERAFAAAARERGVREAFLAFFDADAIALAPHPTPARPRLVSGPARPFSAYELTWEPRVGDVARSGDFGWLTGPTRAVDHEQKDARPRYGSYLSIWRRSGDRPWRVHLDIGVNSPEPAAYNSRFTHHQLTERYVGPQDPATALARLLDADRSLNAAIAADGPSAAYEVVLDSRARLYRSGVQPAFGRTAILATLPRQSDSWRADTGAGAVAASADLGYVYGTLREATADLPGPYVRIWARDVRGRWWLVLDLAERRS